MKRMIEMLGVVAFAIMVVGIILWSCQATPVLQVSNHTREPVACATEDTGWAMVPASHPACASITNAEVEWIP